MSKTDEIRIQNIPFILESNDEWVATEKVDGQSGTFALVRKKSKIPFMKDKFDYIVCSRNRRLVSKDDSSYWRVSDKYHIETVLKEIIGTHKWVAIQGECIGPKIQGNKYKVTDYDMYVFNVIFPEARLGSLPAKRLVNAHGLKFVPIVDSGIKLPKTVEEVLEYAHGTSALCDTLREGIVFRSKSGKASFKAVDPLFLIQHGE